MACVMDWNINKKKRLKKKKRTKVSFKLVSGCDFRDVILLILTSLKLIFKSHGKNMYIFYYIYLDESEGAILNFCQGFLLRFIVLIFSVNCYFIILPGEVCYRV